MRHFIFTLFIVLFSITAFAQTDSMAFAQLQQKVAQLQKELKQQRDNFSKQLEAANDSMYRLHSEIETERARISALADSLSAEIADTRSRAEQRIADVDQSLGQTAWWAIAGILFAVIVSDVVYGLLRRKQTSDRTDPVARLSEAKRSIDGKLVREFARNAETLETLSKMLSSVSQPAGADHSLALKLADEITIMERNINHMNQNIKGLKPLIRAIERLKTNLHSNGYEFVELVGRPYNERMKITIVSSIPDENVDKGIDIISKVIKPQVNYQDKMIQVAQVEVTVGVNE
jgi:septal ring factor EnvC (AmiA/AmiB activator)